MSASLIDLAKQYLTPDVIDKLAAFTGETPAAASKAMAGATPALLAGMLNTAQGTGGLSQLVNLFQQGKFDGSMLGNLSGAFADSSADGLVKAGGPLLSSVFGARSGGLTDLLASSSGVKKSSAATLLGLAAPFVMSLIGKQLASRGGVNAGSLKDLLLSQRQAVAAAAPPGLAQQLGISDLLTVGANEHVRAPVPPVREEKRAPGWLPWLIGLALILLLLSWMRGCGKMPATGVTIDSTSSMSAPVPAPTYDTTTRSAPVTTDTAKPSGTSSTGGNGAAGGAGTTGSSGSAGTSGTGNANAGAAGSAAQPSTSAPAATAPAPTEKIGAMGGQGQAGKDVPTAPAPTPQSQQKP